MSNRTHCYLVKALRAVILPYLFATGREEQGIIFKTEQAKHHATLVGFRVLSGESAVITPEDIPSMPVVVPITTHPTENQKERIKQRLRMASDFIRIARDDFETAFGDGLFWKDLDYFAREVDNEAFNVHDLWKDHKEAQQKEEIAKPKK